MIVEVEFKEQLLSIITQKVMAVIKYKGYTCVVDYDLIDVHSNYFSTRYYIDSCYLQDCISPSEES